MQGLQIDNSPIENFSTTRIFSMWTLIEEIKLVVLVIFDFEFREKLKLKCFLVEYSSASGVFSIEFLIEEIELMVSQN